jgi:hypothetical protein
MTRSTGTSGLIFLALHAGEILHQHPRRAERDLAVRALGLEPLGNGLDILLGDGAAILVAQQILQEDFQREGQPRNTLQPVLLRDRQAEIGVGLGTDFEGTQALEAVERIHDFFPIPPAGRRRNSEVICCRNGLQTGAPQPNGGFIRSFLKLCQFGNQWSANMLRMAQSVEKMRAGRP